MRALSACKVAGCPTPAEPGTTSCKQHRRVRGTPWRKLRQQALDRDRGRCVRCGAGATQVHHVNPLWLGGQALPPLEQLESLCDRCHVQVDETAVGVDRRRRR
jgi:5-methylcytosine-specific restriction endonuclease McrA